MDEETLIAEVVERLAARYPALSSTEISAVVHDLHTAFDGAPLREFVPLFVERRAHSALEQLSVSYA